MNWSAIAAILLAAAVALGAFGAHGLRGRLDAYSMGIYEKAVFYHFVHALGIFLVSLLPASRSIPVSWANWTCAGLLAGIVLFSGSLYVLSVTGIRAFGMVTPLGGVAFILSWAVISLALFRA
jgi:uncharacterized membrane protein YgdD (TMEM256/DUF423 family)